MGFAVYFQSFSTFLGKPGIYLEDLFVVPEWRGRGIGRALLAWVARAAVERGGGRMEWSVLDWNELALGVYRRIGARPLQDWTVQRLTGDALRALALSANAPAEERLDRGLETGSTRVGRDLSQRLEHEQPLPETRMRNDEVGRACRPRSSIRTSPNRIRSRSSVRGARGTGRSRPRWSSISSIASSTSRADWRSRRLPPD